MSSRLYIEPIASEQELRRGATDSELSYVAQFASEHRRRESLAWRTIVRRELGEEVTISYDEWGAPQVDTPDIYISVSHSREVVALLLSDRLCAVDIEEVTRDFRKVATHYLTEQEQGLAERHNLYAEMWSAKEALYKYHRKGGLAFKGDINIVDYDGEAGVLYARLPESGVMEVKVERRNGYIVAIVE